ncbi:MAG TPA: polyprenyl synthetase family protein [Dehalococcoidia bacterium]|nr:polyprenyl synthetase family protein [Dehalococcoidia bacterium]
MPLPSAFQRYRQELEDTLRSILAEGEPALLYRMMRYHLGWEDAAGKPTTANGGKGLRPTVALLACECVGGDWRKALPAAAAIELVHNFSLVHDDIQDQDRERRHRPTVWALWGAAQGINVGDGLLTLAHLAAYRLLDQGIAPVTVVRVARTIDQRTMEMVEGQSMDLSFEEDVIGLDSYLDMIARKTGALFDCSLEVGALIGSEDTAIAEAFGRCGRLLGLAFQVRDDMLGVWGSESETGKPAGADIRRRKKSLPIVYALSLQSSQRERLLSIYSRPEITESDVAFVLDALDKLGASEYCQSMAAAKKREALVQLEHAGLNPEAYRELEEVADFVLERRF